MSKEDDDDEDLGLVPPKRIKIEDVNISRYSEEFLEVAEIANGEFGKVTVARHRLDGMLYAIKVRLGTTFTVLHPSFKAPDSDLLRKICPINIDFN